MNHRTPIVIVFVMVALLQIGCTSIRPTTETTSSTGELAQLRDDYRILSARIEQLQDKLRQLETKVREQQALIDDPRRVSAPKKGTPAWEITTSTPAPEPTINPPKVTDIQDTPPAEIYRKAFSDYTAGRFDQATKGFNNFLRDHPDNEYAGHAQYWLGECFYVQQLYDRAVEAFQKTVERYPEGGKAPEALLKMAAALNQLGHPEHAEKALRILRDRYPDSAAALRSQEKN